MEQNQQNTLDNYYQIKQQIKAHQRCARCIDVQQNYLVTGGDHNISIYKYINNQYIFLKNAQISDKMILTIKFLPNNNIIVGSQDTNIYIISLDLQIQSILKGHKGPVNNIQILKNDQISSGSWDGTFNIWNLKNNECVHTQDGHQHAVTLLYSESNNCLISGSQNKNLYKFDLNDFKIIKQQRECHTKIIRDIVQIDENQFTTCSNDGFVKIWDFELNLISQFQQHNDFIFALSFIPQLKQFISGGDDRLIKIWNQNQDQQPYIIDHPNTIWNIKINQKNEILTCCGDGYIRIFTSDKSQNIDKKIKEEFHVQVQINSLTMKVGEMHQWELHTLPSFQDPKIQNDINNLKEREYLEYKILKDEDKINIYQPDQNNKQWVEVKQICKIKKIIPKHYPGDKYFLQGMYDYIFTVQGKDSETFTKLPFNNKDDPIEVVQKYCSRENINLEENKDKIIGFLNDNTLTLITDKNQEKNSECETQQQKQPKL